MTMILTMELLTICISNSNYTKKTSMLNNPQHLFIIKVEHQRKKNKTTPSPYAFGLAYCDRIM